MNVVNLIFKQKISPFELESLNCHNFLFLLIKCLHHISSILLLSHFVAFLKKFNMENINFPHKLSIFIPRALRHKNFIISFSSFAVRTQKRCWRTWRIQSEFKFWTKHFISFPPPTNPSAKFKVLFRPRFSAAAPAVVHERASRNPHRVWHGHGTFGTNKKMRRRNFLPLLCSF